MSIFGIDLGTTTTMLAKASTSPGDGTLQARVRDVDQTGDGIDLGYLASVCFVERSGEMVVGNRAFQRLRQEGTATSGTACQNFLSNVKKDMGQSLARYKTAAGELTPPDVCSHYIESALRSALEQGDDVDGLAVTVPASFGAYQRRATRKAVELAMKRLGSSSRLAATDRLLLSEPIAALLARIAKGIAGTEDEIDLSNSRKILVYDLGGGTLDIALVQVQADQRGKLETVRFEVLEQSRYTEFGGSDLDDSLAREIHRVMLEEPAIAEADLDPTRRDNVRNILREEGRRLKEDLCDEISCEKGGAPPEGSDLDEISVPYSREIPVTHKLNGHPSMQLSWRRFDELQNEFLAEPDEPVSRNVISPLKEMLALCNRRGLLASKDDVDYLFCVGGSIRCPSVLLALERFWGRPVLRYYQDNEAVAEGAAYYAALCAQHEEFRIVEPPADAYYLQTEDGFKLLAGRRTHGESRSHKVEVASDCRCVTLDIYSGADERDLGRHDDVRLSLRLERPLRLKRADGQGFKSGEPVDLTVGYNPNMEFSLTATSKDGANVECEVTDRLDMS